MPAEVGTIVKGKVTGITKFGAFIEMEGGGTGLCHISEIADGYVKDVNDHLTDGQEVTVKVIGDKGGKISLSIRQAQPKKETPRHDRAPQKKRPERSSERGQDRGSSRPSNQEFRGPKPDHRESKPKGFEDMLSSFMKESDTKLKTIKKQKNNRKGNGYQR